jgi:ribonucleoside-diphosphate reductase alpha subunit
MDNLKKNHSKKTVNLMDNNIQITIQNIFSKYNQLFIDCVKWINKEEIVSEILKYVPDNISINDLYCYISDYCIAKSSNHPVYGTLASNIYVDKLHLTTSQSFETTAKILFENIDRYGEKNPLISDQTYDVMIENINILEEHVDWERDYLFDYFGLKTLEKSYLLKTEDKNGKKVIIERPQHMWMRVAIGIHGFNLKSVIETYNWLSKRYFTHATPTLFNSGTNHPQLASCFLLGIADTLKNIFEQQKEMAMISKWAGGIGVHLTGIRGNGSIIRGTGGKSEGLIPLCIVLNKIARYVNQGGRRPGSIACYIEPYHPDIFEFVELRKQSTGNDDNRALDLFLALWIPDLFMKRVEENGIWSLMCPDQCPNLNSTHGAEFEKLYLQYESEGKYKRQIKARSLWDHIIECQIESGFPYMCYKDHANNKSNQKNLGTIRSSNLCSEIIEYSDENETAVCNLSSICLPKFVSTNNEGKKYFDHDKLIELTAVIVRNLNKCIDVSFYPIESAKKSNMKHRPIGIGVQGLADVYNLMGYPYESQEAHDLNKQIFETIYYGSLVESNRLAKCHGHYESFEGSPFSQGKLQFHLWEQEAHMYDWNTLTDNIKKYGTRNSLLTALMPTAGTSQIMGCSETTEPNMSNIYNRKTMAGEFMVVNKNLVNDLIKLGLWSDDMKQLIIINNGSIQNINNIPNKIKQIYKNADEIKLKDIITQSAERGPFIDQSQSLNLFMKEPDFQILTSAHFHGWKSGIKTGMYYLRTAPATSALQLGLDINDIKRLTELNNNNISQSCSRKKGEGCTMCGS